MKNKKKKIKRKIKWKVLIKLFIVVIIIGVIYLLIKLIPLNHIVIKGNNYVTDSEIIDSSLFKDNPCLYCVSSQKIKSTLLKNPYINNVKIKRNLFGELTIIVDEARPLFFNRDKNKLILSNFKEVETNNLQGVPILTNYVPDELYEKLINGFNKLNSDVINLVSEIIYDPWKNGDVVIDETRFFLQMNDGNHVYTNTIHLDKLNNYIDIYATLEGKKGTLYLDSSSDKISFSLF